MKQINDIDRYSKSVNSFQSTSQLYAFEREKNLLMVVGYYPTLKRSFKRKLGMFLIALLNSLLAWLQFLFMFIFLCTEVSNLTEVSETLLYCLTQLAYLCKLTNFLLNKMYLIEIEKMLDHSFFKDLNHHQSKLFDEYIKPVKILALGYRILCTAVVILYILFPLLDVGSKSEKKKLPLHLWTPYDSNNYYYLTFLLEILSIAVSAYTNSCIDILTVTLITFATAHSEILKGRLQRAVMHYKEKENNEIKYSLNRCIKNYHYIERSVG